MLPNFRQCSPQPLLHQTPKNTHRDRFSTELLERSPQPSAQVALRLRVGDLVPGGMPDEEVDVEEARLTQRDAAVRHLDVDVLERAQTVVQQALAVPC